MKEFRYNNITQPNPQPPALDRPTVDGVKTGHTEGRLLPDLVFEARFPAPAVGGPRHRRTPPGQRVLKLLNWGSSSTKPSSSTPRARLSPPQGLEGTA